MRITVLQEVQSVTTLPLPGVKLFSGRDKSSIEQTFLKR
jgi:hypothetical protein